MEEHYLTPKQVAAMLQLTERTLTNQRHEGRGIPFIKIERAVRYRRSDIDDYFAKDVNPQSCAQEGVGIEEGSKDGI